MSPQMKVRTTMTANGEAFPLVGQQYEVLSFDALVEFACLVDTGGTVRATIYSGTDVLQQNSLVDVLAVASPILWPDHYALSDGAAALEKLSIQLFEGAAGTPIVRSQVKITPVVA